MNSKVQLLSLELDHPQLELELLESQVVELKAALKATLIRIFLNWLLALTLNSHQVDHLVGMKVQVDQEEDE